MERMTPEEVKTTQRVIARVVKELYGTDRGKRCATIYSKCLSAMASPDPVARAKAKLNFRLAMRREGFL